MQLWQASTKTRRTHLAPTPPNSTETAHFLKSCESAARDAGEVLLDWRGRFAVRNKAPRDLVTEADVAAQKTIHDALRAAFPDHDFLGEESVEVAERSSPYQWIVDPLDGTTNYVHGFPHYCVSIALAKDNVPIVGTVLAPETNELFSAAAGQGATLNGESIRTSDVAVLDESLLVASFPAHVRRDSIEVTRFLKMIDHCQSIRRLGAAALNLAYIGAGRLDGYWGLTAHAWDVAAGILIASEAGATVTNMEGEPFDLRTPQFIIASSAELHAEMLPVLAS